MKKIFPFFLYITTLSVSVWQPDFETAKRIAKEKHRLILLNFSGSDWCIPCIQMRKNIFENELFSKMADTTLVLLNADFPRNKKNQLKKATQLQNDTLANIYNPGGKFPFTLLLDTNGKIIRSWEGLPAFNAVKFAAQIKNISDGYR